jgi:hypothetical protein
MSSKFAMLCGIALTAILMADRIAAADAPAGPQYNLSPGWDRIYKIVIRIELPDQTQTRTDYVALHPLSIDSGTGHITLSFDSGTSNTTTESPGHIPFAFGSDPGWIFNKPDPDATSKQFTIDAQGNVVSSNVSEEDAQLSGAQGPAWRLAIPPLPPQGQNSWSTQRPLTLYEDDDSNNGPGFGPFGPAGFGPPGFGPRRFGGPFGQPRTRIEIPANENVNYNADAPSGGLLTVHRHYEMTTAAANGNTPSEHIHGDGQYVFDTKKGVVSHL